MFFPEKHKNISKISQIIIVRRSALILVLILLLVVLVKSAYAFNYTLYGQLKDDLNKPIQAKIFICSLTNSTDPKGNYFLRMPQGNCSINYSIQNFWISIPSFNVSSENKNLINYIKGSANKTSFILSSDKEQTIQVFSNDKPKNVLINGTALKEVRYLSQLLSNTWFYNSSEKKLYVKTPSFNCPDGTTNGECSLYKPKYCNNSKLVSNCSKCGCPFRLSCNTTTGSCQSPPRPVNISGIPSNFLSCNSDDDCKLTKTACCNNNAPNQNTCMNKLFIDDWLKTVNSKCGLQMCPMIYQPGNYSCSCLNKNCTTLFTSFDQKTISYVGIYISS